MLVIFTFSVPNSQTFASKQRLTLLLCAQPILPSPGTRVARLALEEDGIIKPPWQFKARPQDILTASAIQAPSATNRSFLGSQPRLLVFGQRLVAMPRNWLL